MTKPKILVVEDERVVAEDIGESLRKLGYSVVGAAASGVSAIRRAVETEPDLVLMDIKLKGQMDGIDAAGELHHRLGIPVVFLTAYADGEILSRAKKSSPSGYVLKPFDERALRSAVEIALHCHPKEQKLAESERRLVTALRGFDDAVILTEDEGRITFMNRAAERMSGWPHADAAGRRLGDVLTLLDSGTASLLPNPVVRVLAEGIGMGIGDSVVLVSRYGSETPIEGTVTPLRDDDREVVGAAIVFRGVSSTGEEGLSDAAGETVGSRIETLGRLAGAFAGAFGKAVQSVSETAENLKERAAGDHQVVGTLGRILDEARQARLLADRMQALACHSIPRPRTLPLNQAVEALAELLPHVAGRGVSLETCLGNGVGQVSADPVQLELLLLDLVLLLSQRMPCGGKITIETDNVELLPEYARAHTRLSAGRYVVLSLSNAGSVMMPSDNNPRIDCPSVYDLVQELCGDIVIRSEAGRLTTREIYLPRIEEKNAA